MIKRAVVNENTLTDLWETINDMSHQDILDWLHVQPCGVNSSAVEWYSTAALRLYNFARRDTELAHNIIYD